MCSKDTVHQGGRHTRTAQRQETLIRSTSDGEYFALFYAQAVRSTLLVALGSIAATQAAPILHEQQWRRLDINHQQSLPGSIS